MNGVRINDLSREMDRRLVILERAMTNVNHGQGLGFQVFGFVIDKKKLKQIGLKIGALSWASFTAVLAVSSFGSGSSAENTGQCELSSVEVSMVQSVMQQRNASCSYNMTLESILAVIP